MRQKEKSRRDLEVDYPDFKCYSVKSEKKERSEHYVVPWEMCDDKKSEP